MHELLRFPRSKGRVLQGNMSAMVFADLFDVLAVANYKTGWKDFYHKLLP